MSAQEDELQKYRALVRAACPCPPTQEQIENYIREIPGLHSYYRHLHGYSSDFYVFFRPYGAHHSLKRVSPHQFKTKFHCLYHLCERYAGYEHFSQEADWTEHHAPKFFIFDGPNGTIGDRIAVPHQCLAIVKADHRSIYEDEFVKSMTAEVLRVSKLIYDDSLASCDR